jgi:hypothetical protein
MEYANSWPRLLLKQKDLFQNQSFSLVLKKKKKCYNDR